MFVLKAVRVGRTEKLSHRRRNFYVVVYQASVCTRAVKVIDQTVLTLVTPHALFGITYFFDRDEKPFMSRTNSIADHSPLFVDFHPGCAAYLAGPFANTGALFRLDALAISQNLVDVFVLFVLLKFERRVMARCAATAHREQETGRRQG